MSLYVLTAKVTMLLNNGMRVEKGIKFEVNIPFAHLPFDSIASKSIVQKQLEYRGFDFSGHESYLSGGFFDYKKI